MDWAGKQWIGITGGLYKEGLLHCVFQYNSGPVYMIITKDNRDLYKYTACHLSVWSCKSLNKLGSIICVHSLKVVELQFTWTLLSVLMNSNILCPRTILCFALKKSRKHSNCFG